MDLLRGVEEIFSCLDALKQEGAVSDYLLIGGLAVSIWGRPRATRDIDLLVMLDNSADVSVFSRRLTEKGMKNEVLKGDMRDPISCLLKISLETAEVDAIIAAKNWEVEAVENAVRIDFEGHVLPVVSPEYLIVMKLKAGGPRDLLDVQDIIEAGDVDIDKLKALTKKYRLDKKLEKVMKKLDS